MSTSRNPLPSIHLLGPFSVRCHNRIVSLGISGATRDLFAYLLTVPGRDVRREYLSNLLWEDVDCDHARSVLNTAVWRINKLVRRVKGLKLVSCATSLSIEADPGVMIDARTLEIAVHSAAHAKVHDDGMSEAAFRELARAVDGYKGMFLEGSDLTWAVIEREKFFNLYIRGLTILMQDAGLKRVYEDALEYGRRILAADPFREKIQCAVMWLYVLSGQRAHALRQYRDYEALLDHELDIRPMPETRALHAHIISDVERGLEPRDDAGRQASDQNGSELCGRPFDSVLSEIEQSRRKIFQTLVVQSN